MLVGFVSVCGQEAAPAGYRDRTTGRFSYFYLYAVLDLYSRYVIGWMIARHKSAALAKVLIEESLAKHAVEPGALVLHAERGAPMTSKTLALLSDLDITRSFSGLHTSNETRSRSARSVTPSTT